MNYNQFSYYRANPYAQIGSMPPAALKNRHHSDFITQLPQGEEHFAKIGKRMFYEHRKSSNIQDLNLLKSPERFPFENSIALQKSYERNMNTIDIEGAYSGTLISECVKNKQRGKEALERRTSEQNGFAPVNPFPHSDEDRRRMLAYQQYIKNQQSSNTSKQKLSRVEADEAQIHRADQAQPANRYYSLPKNVNRNEMAESLIVQRARNRGETLRDTIDQQLRDSSNFAPPPKRNHPQEQGTPTEYHNDSNRPQANLNRAQANPQLRNLDQQSSRDSSSDQAGRQSLLSPAERKALYDVKMMRRGNPTNLSSSLVTYIPQPY